MSQKSAQGWNIAGIVLYVVLVPVAAYEFLLAGLAFGVCTDGCHDAACDAGYPRSRPWRERTLGDLVDRLGYDSGRG